jgi:hypothetical protein
MVYLNWGEDVLIAKGFTKPFTVTDTMLICAVYTTLAVRASRERIKERRMVTGALGTGHPSGLGGVVGHLGYLLTFLDDIWTPWLTVSI